MSEQSFSNATIDSAHAFRVIMEAMARPGRAVEMPQLAAPPSPFLASTAAVTLTLCDYQTPVWLSPGFRNDAVARYIRFHTGAPVIEDAGAAQFAFLAIEDAMPPLRDFAQGTHEFPDRSATLIIQSPSFHGGPVVELSGPGLNAVAAFRVEGLDHAFWHAMAENNGRFPIGIDVIFTGPGSVAALPRSTSIRIPEPV